MCCISINSVKIDRTFNSRRHKPRKKGIGCYDVTVENGRRNSNINQRGLHAVKDWIWLDRNNWRNVNVATKVNHWFPSHTRIQTRICIIPTIFRGNTDRCVSKNTFHFRVNLRCSREFGRKYTVNAGRNFRCPIQFETTLLKNKVSSHRQSDLPFYTNSK